MAEHPFLRAMKKRLYAVLREEGFKGSGTTLRRQNGPVVHVFNVQGSSMPGRFYLNLGAHLDFLTLGSRRVPDPETIKEHGCAFRERLDPPPDQPHGWMCPDAPEDFDAAVEVILQEWANSGRPWFARHATWPDSFETLIREALATPLHPAHARVLAQLALHAGLRPEALQLATTALAATKPAATQLASWLRDIIAQAS